MPKVLTTTVCLSDMLGTLAVLSVSVCGFRRKMHMNDSETNFREHLYKKET